MGSIIDELQGMNPGRNVARLIQVANGSYDPPRYSRLGAFKAVLGHSEGTLGYGVARAIAAIYITLGDTGEDEIGNLFNSEEVQALLDEPGCGAASLKLAQMEYRYWQGQETIGGFLGSAVNPTVREALQCGFAQL